VSPLYIPNDVKILTRRFKYPGLKVHREVLCNRLDLKSTIRLHRYGTLTRGDPSTKSSIHAFVGGCAELNLLKSHEDAKVSWPFLLVVLPPVLWLLLRLPPIPTSEGSFIHTTRPPVVCSLNSAEPFSAVSSGPVWKLASSAVILDKSRSMHSLRSREHKLQSIKSCYR
jgi:hypothetical protein